MNIGLKWANIISWFFNKIKLREVSFIFCFDFFDPSNICYFMRKWVRERLHETRSELKPVWDSLRSKISLWCKVISWSGFTWFQASGHSLRCKFQFSQFDRSKYSHRSEFSLGTVNACSELKLHRIIKINKLSFTHVQ